MQNHSYHLICHDESAEFQVRLQEMLKKERKKRKRERCEKEIAKD